MIYTAKKIQTIYLMLLIGNTLAASFIWGINTIFLLSAGLSNFEAFAANAFFTAGMVLFEIPTGLIADTRGRKTSYILGCLTLLISTVLYMLLWQYQAEFWAWAVVSVFIGLGFTFFSGALEAWLVDALNSVNYKEDLDSVFAKGQIAGGVSMLIGSIAGGVAAQVGNLGTPYLIRSGLLLAVVIAAYIFMEDIGFKPEKSMHPIKDIKKVLSSSIEHGIKNQKVRWLMLAAPFSAGVGVYVFYALQPYLLQIYGDDTAYGVAGLVAALMAGSQIVGGLAAPKLKKIFKSRLNFILTCTTISSIALIFTGIIPNFWVVLAAISLWGFTGSLVMPVRQTYINKHIPSKQRATVLSFDSLMGSSGGVVIQPALGKVADIYSYGQSYIAAACLQALAIPLIIKAKLEDK